MDEDHWADVAPIDPAYDQAARDMEFSLFYASETPRLVGFLVVYGARVATAGDLAQEAMTEAYRKWNTIDTPRAWVRTVAKRAWLQQARQERIESPQEELPHSERLLSPDTAAEIEQRHLFVSLVHKLPPAQREIMAWTYDGYGPTEIAALLGKPPATVRSVLREARATLRRLYEASEAAE